MAGDYARAVSYLDRSRMPAYVSFVERTSARGIGGAQSDDQRIYVRMSDGKIVSGVPPVGSHAVRSPNGDSDNPFRGGGFFNPQCYVPTNESQTRWNGQPAVRFQLQAICSNENGITELYADPETLRPVAADGVIPDPDDHVSAAVELRYATIGQYTLPSSIRAHAVGHGWLFWVRERVEVDYSAYRFYTTEEFTRRQAAKPD